MNALSPTRRASRATLPARGRDENFAIQDSRQAFPRGAIYGQLHIADAIQSLPLTGRVARREPSRVG
jgi:hypothetical protein